MKRVARPEHETIVGIPDIVRIAVVAVEPQAVIIPFHVEHVEIAVRVGNIQNAV